MHRGHSAFQYSFCWEWSWSFQRTSLNWHCPTVARPHPHSRATVVCAPPSTLPTTTVRARQQETIIPWGILMHSRWVFHGAGERVSPSGHPQLKCRRWRARKSSSCVDDRKHRSQLCQSRENTHSSSRAVCTLVLLIHCPGMKGSLWAIYELLIFSRLATL